MSNVSKYTAVVAAPIAASEPPDWIRRMSDHYAKTGTVRASDAMRLQATQDGVQISASVRPIRDMNFADAAADTVIIALRETQELVKQHGGAYTSKVQQTAAVSETVPNYPSQTNASHGQTSNLAPTATSVLNVWSLGRGVVVELRASKPLTSAQFGILKKYVELAELAERNAELSEED